MLLDEARGRPQRRLSELDGLSPGELKRIKPVAVAGVRLKFEGGWLLAATSADGQTRELGAVMECSPANLAAFNAFNGEQSLDEVAAGLARAMSWEPEAAYVHTRNLFLGLVRRGVCAPANVVD